MSSVVHWSWHWDVYTVRACTCVCWVLCIVHVWVVMRGILFRCVSLPTVYRIPMYFPVLVCRMPSCLSGVVCCKTFVTYCVSYTAWFLGVVCDIARCFADVVYGIAVFFGWWVWHSRVFFRCYVCYIRVFFRCIPACFSGVVHNVRVHEGREAVVAQGVSGDGAETSLRPRRLRHRRQGSLLFHQGKQLTSSWSFLLLLALLYVVFSFDSRLPQMLL